MAASIHEFRGDGGMNRGKLQVLIAPSWAPTMVTQCVALSPLDGRSVVRVDTNPSPFSKEMCLL